MSIRIAISTAAVAMGLAVAVCGEANAQANVLKECGSQYQAAKAANQLAGQSWQEYLKSCRARISEPAAAPAPAASAPAPAAPTASAPAAPPPPTAAKTAPAATPAPATSAVTPAPATTAAPAAPAKPASAGQAAARERQKQCGSEWKTQKAEIRKTDPKATWPKFWSSCNKRLKGEAQ